MTKPMFQIATPENSAKITLNDNMNSATRLRSAEAAPTETWEVGTDPKSLYFVVISYARKHSIPVEDVGYSVKFPMAA